MIVTKELSDKIKKIIEEGHDTDYGYDGENEYPIAIFEDDLVHRRIIELLNAFDEKQTTNPTPNRL